MTRATSRLAPALLLALLRCSAMATVGPDPAPRPIATLRGCSGISVSFSADGRLILTAGEDGARVWDAKTFQPVTKALQDGDIDWARFVAGGKMVFTAGRGTLWDAQTSRHIAGPFAAEKDTGVIGVNSAGTRVVTVAGFHDGVESCDVRIWDVRRGALLATLKQKGVADLATFSPEGKRLLIGDRTPGEARTLHVWDTAAMKEICKPISATSEVRADPSNAYFPAVFSPDGKLIAVAEEAWFSIYDSRTGAKVLDTRPPLYSGGPEVSFGVQFSADGREVVLILDHSLTTWDAITGKRLPGGLHDVHVFSPEFNRDYRKVLCGYNVPQDAESPRSDDGTGIWDLASGTQLFHLHDKAGGAAMSPNFGFAATADETRRQTTVWQLPPESH